MEPAVFISDLHIYSLYYIKIPLNFSYKFLKVLQNLAVTQTPSLTGINIKSITIHLLPKNLEINYGSQSQKIN